jgi:hypothetical protein
VLSLLALLARVITGRCDGGRALSNAAIQLCAAVLLVGVPGIGYYAVPWAWQEYRDLRGTLDRIERMLDIRAVANAAKDAEQDDALARIERRQESQSARLDRLSDRVSRIEGRQR